ncbi:hypothetical protein FB639_005737, partial [Coemansia asiatica]
MRYLLSVSLISAVSLAMPRERVRVHPNAAPIGSVAVHSHISPALGAATMEHLGALTSRHLSEFVRSFDSQLAHPTNGQHNDIFGIDRQPVSNPQRIDIDYPASE